jgi:hypothetical protein
MASEVESRSIRLAEVREFRAGSEHAGWILLAKRLVGDFLFFLDSPIYRAGMIFGVSSDKSSALKSGKKSLPKTAVDLQKKRMKASRPVGHREFLGLFLGGAPGR